jgi:hypothetical protein
MHSDLPQVLQKRGTGGHLRSRLPGHAPSLSRRAFLQSRSQSRAQRVIPNGVAHQFFKAEGAPASSPSAQAAYAPLPSPNFHPSAFFFSSSSHLIFFSFHPQDPTREEHSSHSLRLLSFSIKHSSSLYWFIILHFPAYNNLPPCIRTLTDCSTFFPRRSR